MNFGLINAITSIECLEIEGVKWAKEILQNSPTAIRCLKASFNAEIDGLAGIQELAGQATHLFYRTICNSRACLVYRYITILSY